VLLCNSCLKEKSYNLQDETIARISVELGSRGTVKIISMPTIPAERLTSIIKKK